MKRLSFIPQIITVASPAENKKWCNPQKAVVQIHVLRSLLKCRYYDFVYFAIRKMAATRPDCVTKSKL